jgi:hypothetical protein
MTDTPTPEPNDDPQQMVQASQNGQVHNVVQISGSFENSPVFNGDVIYQYFDAAPTHISDLLLAQKFKPLIHDRTDHFLGRDFIFDTIDHFLDDNTFRSGYIIIQGEPGIGKTSILAELVRRHGYVHHFNIIQQNIRTARLFLGNVCAQLVIRYGFELTSLPSEATQNSSFLIDLLAQAAGRPQNQPVIVLIDALDEAGDPSLPPGANRLLLPSSLPEKVFFIVTSREAHDLGLDVNSRRDIYLREDDPQNLKDIQHFIQSYLHEYPEQMHEKLAEWGISDADFITIMIEKSQGNFMYLVYVLRDIRSGLIHSENIHSIRSLPQGLRGYYQRHWRMMRDLDPQLFTKAYQPVICLLATVREPVSANQLTAWTGLSPMAVTEVIHTWREFLNQEESASGEVLYRLYHSSFQDFLRDEVGLTSYHALIAESASQKINWGK